METSIITPGVYALFHRFFLVGTGETGVRRLHHKSGVGQKGSRVGWQGRDKPCPYYDTGAAPNGWGNRVMAGQGQALPFTRRFFIKPPAEPHEPWTWCSSF